MTRSVNSQSKLGQRLAVSGGIIAGLGLVSMIVPLFWIYSLASSNANSTHQINQAHAFDVVGLVLMITGAAFFAAGLAIYFTNRARSSKPKPS